MSALSVPYQRAQNGEEAFKLAKAQLSAEYIEGLNIHVEVRHHPEENLIRASGKGFDLDLQFCENETRMTLKLGLLLKPFRQTVLQAIEKKLKQTL